MSNILDDLSDIEIAALTIIGEARGEPIEGQVAVGCVIRNRVKYQSSTYKDICLAPLQFSCWNAGDPNRAYLIDIAERLLQGKRIDNANLRQCFYVAQGIINEDIIDNTRGVKNYMTTKLFQSNKRPSWAKAPLEDPVIIGSHTFINV